MKERPIHEYQRWADVRAGDKIGWGVHSGEVLSVNPSGRGAEFKIKENLVTGTEEVTVRRLRLTDPVYIYTRKAREDAA